MLYKCINMLIIISKKINNKFNIIGYGKLINIIFNKYIYIYIVKKFDSR